MLDSVYNYLIPNRISKTPIQWNAHKTSDLRKIYTSILNKSRHSPLYMIKLSNANQSFALDLKDSALFLQTSIQETREDSPHSVFHLKKAFSDDESTVSASMLEGKESPLPEPFSIKVKNLAISQTNMGTSLYANNIGPPTGTYRFIVQLQEKSYEFNFTIDTKMTNEETLHQLSDRINQSELEIQTSVIKDLSHNMVHLSLTSDATGKTDSLLFRLSDVSFPKNQTGIVEFYDLNQVSVYPSNAKFEINGVTKESPNNKFIFNHTLNLTLHNISAQPIRIGYEEDREQILNGIHKLADSYNELIQMADSHVKEQRLAGRLLDELKEISNSFKNELESAGVTFDETGNMKIDDFLANQSITDKGLQQMFSSSNGFCGTLFQKVSQVTIDPMDYIDKVIVTYPNPLKPGVSNPYITSMYSGMLFNYYC